MIATCVLCTIVTSYRPLRVFLSWPCR